MNIETKETSGVLDVEPDSRSGFIGASQSLPIIRPRNTRMRRLLDRARQMAVDPTAILLRGECGAGKSITAARIHQWSCHADGPLVTLRATSGTVPGTLDEAENALGCSPERKPGGTLVLDEIGDFSLPQQAKILRLLDPGEMRAPDDEMRWERIKIITTTSFDLAASVRKGTFREELLSFLTDNSLYLPPLRERPEDITVFAEEMLAYFAREHHRSDLTLEPEAKLALSRFPWPGNVHELRNAIERVVLTAKRAAIGESAFKLKATPESGCNRAGEFLSLDAIEKQQILRVIRAAPTLEEAARILHVDITALWWKRRRFGI